MNAAALSDEELVTLLTRELARRARPGVASIPLREPELVYALVRDMGKLRQEHVRALYLDARGCLLHQETVAIGTLTASLIHPREVFRPALACAAAAVIVAHNHPSGDDTPSNDDRAVTRRLRQAGEILGIELTDHLVVGAAGYTSLRAAMGW